MKYTFVIEATISLHIEVEAASLAEAIEGAQSSGVMGLCHQCARGDSGCWNTSGELDADPQASPLVDVSINDESDEEALAKAKESWG